MFVTIIQTLLKYKNTIPMVCFNIYQTLKLQVTHVVLTLVTLDQMVYKS